MPSHERVQDAWRVVARRFPMVAPNPFWRALPLGTVEHLVCYLAFGDPVAGFCDALIAGDLFRAGCNADSDNGPALTCATKWIKQSWPLRAFGSYNRTAAWRRDGGGAGRERSANGA